MTQAVEAPSDLRSTLPKNQQPSRRKTAMQALRAAPCARELFDPNTVRLNGWREERIKRFVAATWRFVDECADPYHGDAVELYTFLHAAMLRFCYAPEDVATLRYFLASVAKPELASLLWPVVVSDRQRGVGRYPSLPVAVLRWSQFLEKTGDLEQAFERCRQARTAFKKSQDSIDDFWAEGGPNLLASLAERLKRQDATLYRELADEETARRKGGAA